MPDFFLALFTSAANDNAPNDPRDYEDFDPAETPEPWPDDMTVDEFFSRFS